MSCTTYPILLKSEFKDMYLLYALSPTYTKYLPKHFQSDLSLDDILAILKTVFCF